MRRERVVCMVGITTMIISLYVLQKFVNCSNITNLKFFIRHTSCPDWHYINPVLIKNPVCNCADNLIDRTTTPNPRGNNSIHLPLHPLSQPPQSPQRLQIKRQSTQHPRPRSSLPDLSFPQLHDWPTTVQERPPTHKPLPRSMDILLPRTRMGRSAPLNNTHKDQPPHSANLLPSFRMCGTELLCPACVGKTRAAIQAFFGTCPPHPRHRFWKRVLDIYAPPLPFNPHRCYKASQRARYRQCSLRVPGDLDR
jgi:hypothetical protein